jgi:hypothetical protein
MDPVIGGPASRVYEMERYQRALKELEKRAQGEFPGEGSDISGEQKEEVPELLQPDDGPGSGSRPEQETFTSSAEDRHQENRTDYLGDAFNKFKSDGKEVGQQLKGLLDGYNKDAVVSTAQAEDASTKISSITWDGFLNELGKIKEAGGLIGKVLTHNLAPGSGPLPKRLKQGVKSLGQLVKSQVKRHGVKGAIS